MLSLCFLVFFNPVPSFSFCFLPVYIPVSCFFPSLLIVGYTVRYRYIPALPSCPVKTIQSCGFLLFCSMASSHIIGSTPSSTDQEAPINSCVSSARKTTNTLCRSYAAACGPIRSLTRRNSPLKSTNPQKHSRTWSSMKAS